MLTTIATAPTPAHKHTCPPPFHRLRFLSVIGGFLDGQTFEFTDGLNCLIGARGTGKTTALEFIRYALDMLPGREDNPVERRRIESLVQQNLDGGRIQVGIETKDGLVYIVSRSWGEEPIVLDADRQPTDVTLRRGAIFRADIYSQNEVERIADQATSQLDLIDNFESQRLQELELELQQMRAALEGNASQILPLTSQLAAFREELSTLPNVESQLKAFTAGQDGNGAEINRAHALKGLRDREYRAGVRAQDVLGKFARDLSGLTGRLARDTGTLVDPEQAQGPNGAILRQITTGLASASRDVDGLLTQAQQRLTAAQTELAAGLQRLALAHKQQELEFRGLIEQHQQAQGRAAERLQLERLRNDLLAKRRQHDEIRQRLAELHQKREDLLRHLSEARDRRFAVRNAVAERITAELGPAVKVTVTQYGNPEHYQRLLEESLRGARLKHGIVAQRLANALWPTDLSAIIKRKDADALVERAELNSEQAEKVIAALSSAELLFQLEVVELMDEPRLELKDGEEYKDSRSLSTGQKCTAVLPILLLDRENPLLVDQPEDNLDNRFIFETVVSSIRTIKRRRQLVFVTHNPNIPVLADAERVFVLDSNGEQARLVNQGSVDGCKHEVVTLLEGGEEAFKRRRERYSY